jgi:hypothetical protein
MENSNFRKDVVYTVIEGKMYLEWSEAIAFLKMPRTSLMRTILKFNLLSENHVFMYKNRKLLEAQWVFDFWKNLSKRSLEK